MKIERGERAAREKGSRANEGARTKGLVKEYRSVRGEAKASVKKKDRMGGRGVETG